MTNQIHQADLEVRAALAAGYAHCRAGRHRQGCLNNNSPAGKWFAAAYKKWMHLRAQGGNCFTLELGYGDTR